MDATVSMPEDGAAVAVRREDLAFVPLAQDVVQRDEPELARMARRAGDDDAAGIEQRLHLRRRAHRGPAISTSASTATGRPSTTISGLTSTDTMSGSRVRERAEPEQGGREHVAIDRGLAPEGTEQRLGLELVDHLVGVDPLAAGRAGS